MKKNYIKPVIKAYKISANTILAGSDSVKVSGNQAAEDSEGLAKFDFWDDED